jgi:hypothetical protein
MYSGAMISNSRFALLAGPLVIWSAACSSSSSTPSAPDASDDATASDGGQTPPAPDDAASGAVDAAPAGDAGTVADADAADASAPAVDASAACVSYCACMATNCPDTIFGSGCLYECATQTTWDLPCRANMCSLVQAQPNNDHCTHAFGVNECLDE